MSQQQILLICIIMVALLVTMFLRGRKVPSNNLFKISYKSNQNQSDHPKQFKGRASTSNKPRVSEKEKQLVHRAMQNVEQLKILREQMPPPPRALNIFFNYNGHTFDAYEVLGVAGGAGFEDVQKAYHKQLTVCDYDSREFYLAAFEAIVKTKRN